MSQTVARRIPIGPVQAYLNTRRLGTGKSQAVLNWNYDLITGRTGDNLTEINARKGNETATMVVTIADLKPIQLRNAMAMAKSLTNNTMMTDNFLSSTTVAIRRDEMYALTGSGGSTTGYLTLPGNHVSDTVAIYSLDYETEYVNGVNFGTAGSAVFRLTGATDALAPLSGQYVMVHYDGNSTASYVRGGGADALLESELRLVGKDAAGKYLQFRAWRAVREGAMNIQINAKGEYEGAQLTFRLLGSVSAYNKGSQLFEISIED